MTWHRKIPGQAACGPCCGIKEKLQTLWDRTINSILRINQIEPDDQGNIRITSDSEALTVTEGTNEIILGLDTSELPAAAVTSVNGETGAVQLTGADIPSLYNGTVNSNLAGLWGTKAQQSDLNTEITNRQNADTTLQNNINALQASIPQEAADAVAADPTVQSFAAAAADIPNKVDKRTGSGLRAYTHDGSTQDDTPVTDGTTGTTIPIRDANGRLQAADPAAGATDKTLVTANWVSQTGDSGPNNLVHKTGNETILNRKTFTELSQTILSGSATYSNETPYFKLGHIDRQMLALIKIRIGGGYTAGCDSIDIMFHTFNISTHYGTYRMRKFNSSSTTKVYIAYNADTPGYDIWVSMPNGITWIVAEANIASYGNIIRNTYISDGSLTPTADPSANYSTFSEIQVIN